MKEFLIVHKNNHLLLDSRIVAKTDNAALRVGTVKKNPANPLFGEEHDWEIQYNNLYPNVMYDAQEKLYKIWYFTYTYDPAYAHIPSDQRLAGKYMEQSKQAKIELNVAEVDDPRTDGLGYAVSEDGIDWTKPMMDICPWKGKPSNMVMAPGHGIGVMKDVLESDPARRYKMICQMGMNAMGVAFSPDGLHWSEVIPTPQIESAGDTHNNVLWSPELKKYVVITRLWSPEPDNQRLVGRCESDDFIHWTQAVEVLRSSKEKQTYAMPIFRYGDVYLGFPAIVDLETDCTQTELAWSPDTVSWHRIDSGTPLIPNGKKAGDYDWGTIHASCPVLVDDEIRIYYGGCDGRHSYDWRKGYVCLATLGLDRFAGYEPQSPGSPAVIITTPMVIDTTLTLTADAEGGSIKVCVLDEQDTIRCVSEKVTGDVTNAPVIWKEADTFKKFIGQKIRLRFEIENAKLYSFL